MSDASSRLSATLSRRGWLLPAAVLVAAVVGASVRLWPSARKSAAPGTAPDPLALLRAQALTTPEGQPVQAQTWLGKPLVLNFWAPWCPPCVQEMPELDAFAQARPDWQVLGVALDSQAAVQAYAKLHPVRFALVVAGLDALPLVRAFGNAGGGLPYTVLLSAEGKVLHTKAGATTQAQLLRWTDGA